MTAPIMWLGFILGLRHALEADHVAAVLSLSARSTKLSDTARVASAWGLGHASMLLAVGGAIGALGLRFPAAAMPWMDAAAGVLLAVLGIDVLRRLRHHRDDHESAATDTNSLVPRALLVGGMHGMAGSAALVVVLIPALRSPVSVLAYLALFGVGSILGMLLCSLLIAVPLRLSTRFHKAARGLQFVVGTSSIVLGGWVGVKALW